MSNIKFDFGGTSGLGIASLISLVLVLLNVGGYITCSIWWILAPILAVIVYKCLLIFLLGVIVLILLAAESSESKDDSDEDDKKWQDRLKEKLEEKKDE